MAKLLKHLMWVLIPAFSFCFTSCGDDDEPNDPNNQTTISEEILINSSKGLELYKDDMYNYIFRVQGNAVRLCAYVKNDEGNYVSENSDNNSQVDGQWMCGMQKFENRSSQFESFSTKLTNYTATPTTLISAPNRGDIYATYVRTAKGDYRHYKVRINEISFKRTNGLISSVNWMKVVYMSY